jgi:hypothetical protein
LGFHRHWNQELVVEKAKLSAEAAALRARVDALDHGYTASGDPTLDELRRALDIAVSKALERV